MSGATITDLKPMPGNAGLSFGFSVHPDGDESVRRLVIRFAPPGVTRKGNTDVLRQVPLLGVLEDAGIPVAHLVWSTGDPVWFGTDAIVQDLLPAKPLHMYDRAAGVQPLNNDTDPYVERAVSAIVAVHQLDWQSLLGEWEAPRTMGGELDFWQRLLGKAAEGEWKAAGERLGDVLRKTDPGHHAIGIFHGDYQTNNILFDQKDGHVSAIVDWEIAGIGPVGVDAGWLSMMTDELAWHEGRARTMKVRVEPEKIRSWYEKSSGHDLVDFDWYRAYACFRYGSIAGFNVRLHRTGHRVDPENELTAPSVPALFARGLAILGH